MLKPRILTGALLLSLTACGPDTADRNAAPPQKPETGVAAYDAEVFFDSTIYGLNHGGGHAFSADGSRLLVNSDRTGVFNVYAMDLETDRFEALSASDDNEIFAVSFFPDDDRVLLTGDVAGNEHHSVFVVESDGTLHDLLPPRDYEAAGLQSGLRFEAWQDDGEAFYLSSTERDPQLADLYRYDADTLEREMVFRNTRELPFPTRGFNISAGWRWTSIPPAMTSIFASSTCTAKCANPSRS